MRRYVGYALGGLAGAGVLLSLVLALEMSVARAGLEAGTDNGAAFQSVNRSLKGDRLAVPAPTAVQSIPAPRPAAPKLPGCPDATAPRSPFAQEVVGRCVV
jgi:hypothetical protein